MTGVECGDSVCFYFGGLMGICFIILLQGLHKLMIDYGFYPRRGSKKL